MRIFKNRRASMKGQIYRGGQREGLDSDPGEMTDRDRRQSATFCRSSGNSPDSSNSSAEDVGDEASSVEEFDTRGHTRLACFSYPPEETDSSALPCSPTGPYHQASFSEARIRSMAIADSVMKGFHFGTAVLASTARVTEMKGLAHAPKASRAAYELSEYAEHVKEQVEANVAAEQARRAFSSDFAAVIGSPRLSNISIVEEDMETDEQGSAETVAVTKDMQRLIPYPFLNLSNKGKLEKLTIVTFNAGLLAYKLCGKTWYQNPPFTRRRLTHIPGALKGTEADVIALQEVYDESQADYLSNALRLHYPFIGRRNSGGVFALHNGLMLLSRFPIVHCRFTPFKTVTWIEGTFGSKGILEACVEIPGLGPVTFLNSHLASGAVDPESDALETLRNEQIRQIFGSADAAVERQEIPLVVGDLNAAPNVCPSNYYGFLRNGWRDTYLEGSARRSHKCRMDTDNVSVSNAGHELVITQPDLTTPCLLTAPSCEADCSEEISAATGNSSEEISITIDDLTNSSFKHMKSPPTTISAVETTAASSPSTVANHMLRASGGTTTEHSNHATTSSAVDPCEEPLNSVPKKLSQEYLAVEMNSVEKSKPRSIMASGRTSRYPMSIRPSHRRDRIPTQSSESQRLLAASPRYTTENTNSGPSPVGDNAMRYKDFTWDPENPLNEIGPHSDCHGQRCDHILIPPRSISRKLSKFIPASGDIVFKEPRVMVEDCCLGWCGWGSAMLVTLSDHYGVRIELQNRRGRNYSQNRNYSQSRHSNKNQISSP